MRGRGLSAPLVSMVILAAMAALTACGSHASKASATTSAKAPHVSKAISFKDDAGATVHLGTPARRIVSLGPSDTEILLALGLKKDLVGADDDSFHYLPKPYAGELAGVADVGSAAGTTPNLEKIVSLKPDLVLAVYKAPYLQKLASLGLKVAVLDPQSVLEIENDVVKVGEAAGVTARATAYAKRMRQEISKIAAVARSAGTRPSVFVELGPKLYTVGPGSFIDALVTLAGGTNVADAVAKTPYPQLSSEEVVKADPQVIILQDQGFGGSPAAVAKRPGWGAIAAVKDGRVVSSVNPDLLSDPGPAVVQGLLELAKALHPGLAFPKIGAAS